MVSRRCKMLVNEEFIAIGIHPLSVELGVVDTTEDVTSAQHAEINIQLKRAGLEILDSKTSILLEKIKTVVIEMIHYSDESPILNYSDHISKKLHYDYTYLSNFFSHVQGMTLQHFIISHKIERAKELIMYNELTLTEIAYRLQYGSVQHLSTQFKKITGLTPSFFKTLKKQKRIELENL